MNAIRRWGHLTPGTIYITNKTLLGVIGYRNTAKEFQLINLDSKKGCPIDSRTGLTAQW